MPVTCRFSSFCYRCIIGLVQNWGMSQRLVMKIYILSNERKCALVNWNICMGYREYQFFVMSQVNRQWFSQVMNSQVKVIAGKGKVWCVFVSFKNDLCSVHGWAMGYFPESWLFDNNAAMSWEWGKKLDVWHPWHLTAVFKGLEYINPLRLDGTCINALSHHWFR